MCTAFLSLNFCSQLRTRYHALLDRRTLISRNNSLVSLKDEIIHDLIYYSGLGQGLDETEREMVSLWLR